MPAQRASLFARPSFWIGAVILAALVAAAAYEIEANRQHIGLIAIERTLQSKNIDNMPFDAAREALVIDSKTGLHLLIRYQLPSVYERSDGAITAYKIATRAECETSRNSTFIVANIAEPPLSFCVEKATVPQPANILDVGTTEPFTDLDGRAFFPSGPTITFVRNGRRQGAFTAGSVEILPYLPGFAVTCSPACSLSLAPERIALDALSGPADSRTADPLPGILGLKPRSAAELTSIGWPQISAPAG
jgi:hypothetical protein